MRQEYTNLSIASRIEVYYFYFAQISTKKVISEKLGFRIDNPMELLNFFFFEISE
jgi:hypothetical protein